MRVRQVRIARAAMIAAGTASWIAWRYRIYFIFAFMEKQSDEQLQKAKLPISITPSGRLMEESDSQP